MSIHTIKNRLHRSADDSSRLTSNRKDKQVEQLLELFPNGDADYFRSCLDHYSNDAVERVTEKIMDCGGYYPQIPSYDSVSDNRLNACLRLLALEIFPDCDIGFLRERVLRYTCAHVENVTEELLKLARWPERLNYGKMDRSEGIHGQRYKDQAQAQLVKDFPQIWKSSIQAVLAENNWDYLKSHDQLQDMGSGGFWESIKNLWMHWHTSHTRHYVERDPRLATQLEMLEQRRRETQEEHDFRLAKRLNEEEYDRQQQFISCDCCYGDTTFEDLLFCSQATHAFCHDCIRHYLSEGLFGQGSLRGQAQIGCIASTDDCPGCLPTLSLKRVLTADVWKAYEQSQLEDCFPQQRIQCCACSYFEWDESAENVTSILDGLSGWVRSLCWWLMVVEIPTFSYFLLSRSRYFYYFFVIALRWFIQWDLSSNLEIAHQRLIRTRRGRVLHCKNPECNTVTCLQCQRPFRGLHQCYEKETDGLRLYVEKAMADAVKRTCPNCSLSFQKSDGCNKIVCRCGYTMCYVCRKDILKESYKHFCDHFRAIPGSQCTKCTKCDLYKTDPEDQAIQSAAEKARGQYLQAHPEIRQKIANHTIQIGPKNRMERLSELDV
ncbi:hypothetical protein G6F57_008878 [Rhizopus arrhizus]|nr:hypothetical protein G6F30_009887 [Rhizopus arrhizus]KAG0985120.1 hypothetical protein G6F29_004264 [Rhizopus arrhizus]KAG0995370.1 hypothetical protein G6F28_004862 [Rhizopus arrhizus]KAG1005574.1 hypothetical protein G6F27_009101 [Rhizopus arrhizus]KAG1026496.1 hypothetical protein G6F26_004219 [Rhizopus arrhizus]